MASGYLSPAPPRVLAHRGLALEAPENTLLAFVHAIAAGATHLETDVRGSADGTAVCCHDETLERLTGDPVEVARLSMAELRTIRLPSEQTFCSLAEALDAFPQTRFNIDVKSVDAIEPTIEAVRTAGAEGRVLIGSFSGARRRATLRGLPGAATSVSGLGALTSTLFANLGLTPLVGAVLRRVDAVQLPERIGPMPTATPRVVRAFHAAGVEVHIWTIDDPPRMAALLDAGVDGLVTNRADLAVDLLRARADR